MTSDVQVDGSSDGADWADGAEPDGATNDNQCNDTLDNNRIDKCGRKRKALNMLVP